MALSRWAPKLCLLLKEGRQQGQAAGFWCQLARDWALPAACAFEEICGARFSLLAFNTKGWPRRLPDVESGELFEDPRRLNPKRAPYHLPNDTLPQGMA